MFDQNYLERLKSGLPVYVQQITEPDRKAGRNMYKCPLCGSGKSGKRNSDGAFSITPDGKFWKCFSCGKSGNIFTLIKYHEGIEDFKDQVKRADEILGINMYTEYTKNTGNSKFTAKSKTETEKPKVSKGKYYAYIQACNADASKTDYFKSRGFNDDVVRRFNLGYDASKETIVIPYSKDGSYYITRSVKEKIFRKPKSDDAGEEPVYNEAALYDGVKPCFVCESPIDAISIMIAGYGKCNAVSLGGTGSEKLLKVTKDRKPTAPLILSFDADDPGRKASISAAEELNVQGVFFINAVYSDNYPENLKKDPNDYLRGNRRQFEKDIQANIKKVLTKLKEIFDKKYSANTAAYRLRDFIDGIKNRANTPCVSTGFDELDAELDGGFYPGLYVMGAISSLGKTTLMLQIADQIAAAGHDVVYISLEMAASELMSKTISRLTYSLCDDNRRAKTARGITAADRYNYYTQDEKNLIIRAEQAYIEFADRLYFYEGVGDIGVDKIREIVFDHKKYKGKAPIVFIDYLQILAPYDMRASDKQNTDKSVLELKRLSRDFKTPVVTISSFNRDSYTGEVTMSAFKESGAIEYGSDVLLALQPQGMKPGYTKPEQKENVDIVKRCKRKSERQVEVVVLKNRNAPTGGKVGFKYKTLFNSFEIDNTYLPETSEEDSVIPYGAQAY